MSGPLKKEDRHTLEFSSKTGILDSGMLQKYINLLWKNED